MVRFGWFLFAGCLLLPVAAWAQADTGNIAGVVRDASGAVIPGVTVEVASPALIEKIRTAVTDDQGRNVQRAPLGRGWHHRSHQNSVQHRGDHFGFRR